MKHNDKALRMLGGAAGNRDRRQGSRRSVLLPAYLRDSQSMRLKMSRSVADVYHRYIPFMVSDRFMMDCTQLKQPELERFAACVAFVDISGFTKLSERLVQEYGQNGAEKLNEFVSGYFERLIDAIQAYGGDIIKFAGDAMLVVWRNSVMDFAHELGGTMEGDDVSLPQLVSRAVACNLYLMNNLNNFQPCDGVKLTLHCGLGAGVVSGVFVGGVGNVWEFFVAGNPIEQMSDAAEEAKSGQVIISHQAYRLIEKEATGKLLQSGNFKIKGLQNKPVMFHRPMMDIPLGVEQCLAGFVPIFIRSLLRPSLNRARQLSQLHQAPGEAAHSQPVIIDPTSSEFSISEYRKAYILFVLLPGLNYEDPAVLDRLQHSVTCVQTAVQKYEGYVARLLADDKGTRFKLVFGMPTLAHEDDGARAVLTALDIERGLREIGMHTSIGVATGMVFCGEAGSTNRCEYTAVGFKVILAARLMQKATQVGGGIILEQEVKDAAQHHSIQYARLQPVVLKGVGHPVDIFRPSIRGAHQSTKASKLLGLGSAKHKKTRSLAQQQGSFRRSSVVESHRNNHANMFASSLKKLSALGSKRKVISSPSTASSTPTLSSPVTPSRPLRSASRSRPPSPPDNSQRDGDDVVPLLDSFGLVGRGRELRYVFDGLLRLNDSRGSSTQPDTSVTVVTGEPGIGKTAVASACMNKALSMNVRTLYAQGVALESSNTYFPFRQILAQLLRLDSHFVGKHHAEKRRERVLQCLQGEERLLSMVALLNPLLDTAFEEDTVAEMTADARARNTRKIIVHLIKSQHTEPVMVVLEDLCFLDSASWPLVLDMCTQVPGLLVLLTTRPLPRPVPTDYTRLFREANAKKFELGSLSRDEAAAMACGRMSVRRISPQIATLIYEKTHGHPLYIEEIMASLVDRGMLETKQDEIVASSHTTAQMLKTAFPNSVHELIVSRIDHLPHHQQVTLKVCSVVQGHLSMDMLHHVHPSKKTLQQLEEDMEALVESGFMQCSVSSNPFQSHASVPLNRRRSSGSFSMSSSQSTTLVTKGKHRRKATLGGLGTGTGNGREKDKEKEKRSDSDTEEDDDADADNPRHVFLIFKQSLFQEVAEKLLTLSQKQKIHLAVAEYFTELTQDSPSDASKYYDSLAYHWKMAGENDVALKYNELAGTQALKQNANSEAVTYFRTVLQLMEDLDEDGTAKGKAAGWSDQKQHVMDAHERARKELAHVNIAAALYGMGRYSECITHYVTAMDCLNMPVPVDRKLTYAIKKLHTKQEWRRNKLRIGGKKKDYRHEKRSTRLRAGRILEQLVRAAVLCGEEQLAEYCAFALVDYSEKLDDPSLMALGYANAAYVCLTQHRTSMADNFTAKAEQSTVCEGVKDIDKTMAVQLTAMNLAAKGQFATALVKIRWAKDHFKKLNEHKHWRECMLNLAIMKHFSAAWTEARNYFKKLRRFAKEDGDMFLESTALLWLAHTELVCNGPCAEVQNLLDDAWSIQEELTKEDQDICISITHMHNALNLDNSRKQRQEAAQFLEALLEGQEGRAMLEKPSLLWYDIYRLVHFISIVLDLCKEVDGVSKKQRKRLLDHAERGCKAAMKFAKRFPYARPYAYLLQGKFEALLKHSKAASKNLETSFQLAQEMQMKQCCVSALFEISRTLIRGHSIRDAFLIGVHYSLQQAGISFSHPMSKHNDRQVSDLLNKMEEDAFRRMTPDEAFHMIGMYLKLKMENVFERVDSSRSLSPRTRPVSSPSHSNRPISSSLSLSSSSSSSPAPSIVQLYPRSWSNTMESVADTVHARVVSVSPSLTPAAAPSSASIPPITFINTTPASESRSSFSMAAASKSFPPPVSNVRPRPPRRVPLSESMSLSNLTTNSPRTQHRRSYSIDSSNHSSVPCVPPLEPASPRRRSSHIVNHSTSRIIICTPSRTRSQSHQDPSPLLPCSPPRFHPPPPPPPPPDSSPLSGSILFEPPHVSPPAPPVYLQQL